jgi:hypothetical protein
MLLQATHGGETLAKHVNQPDRPNRNAQHGAERVRQVRGLLLLALAALLFAVLRAGVGRVFTPGWWRLW